MSNSGYGYISGLQTKGYAACPVCGDSLESTWSVDHHKCIYMGNAKYLPLDHPLREDAELNSGMEAQNFVPIPQRKDSKYWEKKWADMQAGVIPEERFGVTRWSILYQLPYWKVSLDSIKVCNKYFSSTQSLAMQQLLQRFCVHCFCMYVGNMFEL